MRAMAEKTKSLELDPRTKLLFMMVLGTFSFMAPNVLVLIWNYAVVLAILLLSRDFRAAAKSGALCLAALCLDLAAARLLPDGMLRQTLSMFLFMAERILPMLVLANWMAGSVRISDFVTALQHMRVPKGFTITLAVALRFLPTVRYEFRGIKNTMKLRGVGLTFKNIATDPVRTMEYALVPLLLRSMKIADELAASTLTRGLDREGKRTSLREVRLRPRDFILAILLLAAMFTGLFAGSFARAC